MPKKAGSDCGSNMGSESEGEGGGGEKFAKDELDQALGWDAKSVSVDKSTLQGREGRRANRGFTVAMGRAVDDSMEKDMEIKRSAKRAQTLPNMGARRGDYEISETSLSELKAATEELAARMRRGSVGVVYEVIPPDALAKCWADFATMHTHGKMTDGQQVADERERAVVGDANLPDGTVISCQKGSKGFRDTSPNQDNFSLTYFKNGWTLACCMDGHGPWGHLVSTRAVQTVPFLMCQSEHWEKDMEKALTVAFELAHKELLALSLRDDWDIQASGSTAVAALWKGNKVYTANAGDSRCVIGYKASRKMAFETTDHKPEFPEEKKRIEANGGEVRSQTYPDGWTVHRIFVKGQDFPGLCMTRTLGDQSVKDHGVVPTPEVKVCEVDMANEPFMLLASDGVWEFLDSEFVTKAVAKKIASDGPERTVQKLQREARKRWKQEEGDYCDDITSVFVTLH
eukprot:TRINITY_DN21625_c5_g1_i1.p1 TRINITY_DN21625_c5_g1~~TRINITY_DN21625_c5_g1_i1.p1  ORF type:complete len:457 (+),score=111.45 TRINITY_DN21625_c5_g1_i1:91-1461(+)